MAITVARFESRQNAIQETVMPILMLALVALGAFGVIGFMLAMASTLEQRKGAKKNTAAKHAS
jgi:hypothetical protein